MTWQITLRYEIMELNKDSYVIKRKTFLDGVLETITISKDELKAWRDHYQEVVTNIERYQTAPAERDFYSGKVDVLNDLLKYFDTKEE